MAQENIVTNIVANSDFSALIADLNRVSVSLSKLQSELVATNRVLSNQAAKISQNFVDTLTSTGQFSARFVQLNTNVEKFGKQLDSGQLKLKDFFRVYQDHTRSTGGLIRDLARQQVQLQNSILQPLGKNAQGLQQFNVLIPKGLDEVKNKTSLATKELQIMNRVVQSGANQLINWGKNTQWAGRQLTVGLTIPIAAFGRAASEAFRTADQELTRLTKVYGDVAGTSADELGRVRDDVIKTSKELAQAYGVSFRETIALAADIAATGQQGSDLLASVAETSRLAVLGEVDRQEAMKATLAIQTAFRQNTTELAESINFLNAVENQTSTSLNDLVEAIPKAGPVIKGLGGSIQDLALYMTAMREGGISAGEGANALKSGLASLINPTDVAVAKLGGFGIDILGIVNKNAGNVTGTLLELQKALDTLAPLQRQQAIEQLFGKFQFSRLNALFNNLGKQGSQTLQVFELMNASADELANVAERELTAVTESAAGKYRRAMEGLRAELATIGEQFLAINTKLIEVVTTVIKFVTDLPKPIKQILAVMGGFTAVAGPLIMLTGVLGNFFGYIIKGVMHFKALFKGGEGWKFLTPEILAAEKAGSLIEQTFYDDARAAAVLKQAIAGLSTEFEILEQKAREAAIAVGGAKSASGFAGVRTADKTHPLVGSMGTRASAHMIPRNIEQPGTIFGLVPAPIPVNALIGENPQVYMKDDLPLIPGLTAAEGTRTIGGQRQRFQVSTGIVAEEASRHHAMMAALAMQSKAEILQLKSTIANTGMVTKEFMGTFDDLLPAMQDVTGNAVTVSSAIVAEFRAGLITLEQARSRIIQLNIETERMLGIRATEIASGMGRTINLTNVPTLDQPVVDATGRSNMRELFKKKNTRSFINRLGEALGVRTSGGGFSIETTKPRRFRTGIVGAGLTLARGIAQRLGLITSRSSKPAYKFKSVSGVFGANIPGMTRESANAMLEAGNMPVGPYIQSLLTAGNGVVRGGTDAFISALLKAGIINPQQADDLLRQISSNYITKISKKKVIGDTTNPYWTESNKVIGMNFKGSPDVLSLWKQFSAKSPVQTSVDARRSGTYKNIVLTTPSGDRIVIPYTAFRGSGNEMFLHATNPVNFAKNIGQFTDGVTRVPGYGGGDRVPALIEQGESVVTKEATAGNEKALSMMNAGLKVDQMLPKFKLGVVSAFTQGVKNPYGKGMIGNRQLDADGNPIRTPMGMGSQMALGIGGGIAGSIIGGPLGTGIMLASNILPALTLLRGLGGTLGIVTRLATVLGKLTIPGALLTGAFLLGKYLLNVKKTAEEVGQANRMAFGGDSETVLKEAGIKYKTMEERLKGINDQLELQQAQGLQTYRSLTQSGVPGLTLTISELKNAIKEAKEGSKETVEAFNNIDATNVNQLAATLKQQFVSAGMSVQDATNKIYAIIKASEKGALALSAITSKSFIDIKDKSSAADFAVKRLAKTLSDRNLFNAEEFASGIDSMLTALDSYRQSLIGTTVDDKTLTDSDALRMTLEKINEVKFANNKLDEDTINNIKKQNLLIGGLLGKVESLASIYAKVALAQAGFMEGLQGLSAAEAIQMAQGMQAFSDALDTIGTSTEEGSPLKSLNEIYNEVAEAAKQSGEAAKTAAKLTTKSIDDQIKARQKIIDKLQKEKEERLEILNLQEKSQDFETQLAQAQIRYQEAISMGNMTQAAQEQLTIEQLKSDRERDLARNAIEDKYEKDIDKLRAEIERLQSIKDRQQATVENKQKTAAELEEERVRLENFRARLLDLSRRNPDLASLSTKERQALSGSVDAILNEMDKAGGLSAEAAAAIRKDYSFDKTTIKVPKKGTITRMPQIELLNSLGFGATNLARTESDGAFAKAVDKFVSWIDKLINKQNSIVEVTKKDLAEIINEYRPRGFNPYNEEGFLKESARQDIINALGLERNQVFRDPLGNEYVVKIGASAIMDPRAVRKASGGYIKGYEPGGPVSGPGTSTSDSIPAYLSDGEYVVRAAAVEHYGVDTFEAMNAKKLKDGGPISPYDKKGRPTGSPYGTRWGELVRDIHGLAYGRDIWGGTEIPGLKFTGKHPQHSDYWHQMQEQPGKPLRGSTLGIAKDLMSLLGSVPFEGLFGGGIGFGGMLTMKDGGQVKKSGWLQKFAEKLTGMPAAEMLGTASLLRKLAGTGQEGDTLNAALFPLNFLGLGAGRATAGAAKNIGLDDFGMRDFLGKKLRSNMAIKNAIRTVLGADTPIPLINRTSRLGGAGASYSLATTSNPSFLNFATRLQGVPGHYAIHEAVHAKDAEQTLYSFNKLMEKVPDGPLKDAILTAFRSGEAIKPGLGYTRVDAILAGAAKDPLMPKQYSDEARGFYRYFTGLQEGYATDTTNTLSSKFKDIVGGGGYSKGYGYEVSLGNFLKTQNMYANLAKSAATASINRMEFGPEKLQGILDASPNMPASLRESYLKAIAFLQESGINELTAENYSVIKKILDISGMGKLSLAGGGYVQRFGNGGAPHSLGMRGQVPPRPAMVSRKNNRFFQTIEDALTFGFSNSSPVLFGKSMLNLFGKNMLSDPKLVDNTIRSLIRGGTHPFKEIVAGSGTKGDFFNAALFASPAIGKAGSALFKLKDLLKGKGSKPISDVIENASVKSVVQAKPVDDPAIQLPPGSMTVDDFIADIYKRGDAYVRSQDKKIEQLIKSSDLLKTLQRITDSYDKDLLRADNLLSSKDLLRYIDENKHVLDGVNNFGITRKGDLSSFVELLQERLNPTSMHAPGLDHVVHQLFNSAPAFERFLKMIEETQLDDMLKNVTSLDPSQMLTNLTNILGKENWIDIVKKMGYSAGGKVKMPSYAKGVKYLEGDTIAQLHAKEAVLPENMNPWNPNATNPIGGATYYVQPTINAAPGMDEMALARMATDMTLKELTKINTRRTSMDGRNRLV